MNTLCLLAQDNATGQVFGGAVAVVVFFWIIGIAATIFWLWMLIDALTNEPTTNDKILWFLVIFFLHLDWGAGLFLHPPLRTNDSATVTMVTEAIVPLAAHREGRMRIREKPNALPSPGASRHGRHFQQQGALDRRTHAAYRVGEVPGRPAPRRTDGLDNGA